MSETKNILDARASGVLAHITSLPGPYGMGELGPQARTFVDQLADMKQRLWQVLPIGPTSYGDSPYQSPSTFAGNHLLLSFEDLLEEGLLTEEGLELFGPASHENIDFGDLIPRRMAVLQWVCKHFNRRASSELKQEFKAFCQREAHWLDEYAHFMAIKDSMNGIPWTEWPRDLALRDREALRQSRAALKKEIRQTCILQFLFDRQWERLRAYAAERSIRLIGDIPIFVAHDSSDVWSEPSLFFLEPDGSPSVVAGVPPDYFSETGQLWGNPLYNWTAHRAQAYRWWKRRMERIFEWFDVVRIDHFRGFESYWEIPADEETAIHGEWIPGPGDELFTVLNEFLGELPIIAEDLGIITDEVEALRDRLGFPGMRVLQFAFGNDAKAEDYKPHNYPANCIVYTGTHDNDTTVGWFHSEAGEGSTRSQEDIDRERQTILDYVQTCGDQIHWDLVALALRSNANIAIIPLQDLLGLGTEARMNVPGVLGHGNWAWRFQPEELDESITNRFRNMTIQFGRAAS